MSESISKGGSYVIDPDTQDVVLVGRTVEAGEEPVAPTEQPVVEEHTSEE